MKNRELIINNYIDGYNKFDIDKMVADLWPIDKFKRHNHFEFQDGKIIRLTDKSQRG